MLETLGAITDPKISAGHGHSNECECDQVYIHWLKYKNEIFNIVINENGSLTNAVDQVRQRVLASVIESGC